MSFICLNVLTVCPGTSAQQAETSKFGSPNTRESLIGQIHKSLGLLFSRIREHSEMYNHSINEENFNIKFRANNSLDLRIAESLLILKEKPDLMQMK